MKHNKNTYDQSPKPTDAARPISTANLSANQAAFVPSPDEVARKAYFSYPTMRFFGSFSLYLDVQYFDGYGESLLAYNQRTDELRVGFALFR